MRNSISCILLVFLLLFNVSCAKTEAYYQTGKFEKTVQNVDSKATPTKQDYYYKIKSLAELGRPQEARESVLLYLLMADENDDRSFVTDLFVDLQFSDVLNILILKPTDGLKSRIALYKSYTALGDTAQAVETANLLTENLNFRDFCTLIVNYPCSSEYNVKIFKAWLENLLDADMLSFTELLQRFVTSEIITEESAKDVINLCDTAMKDERFKNEPLLMSKLYKISGLALEKLHDRRNSSFYYREALILNPQDPELIELTKGTAK